MWGYRLMRNARPSFFGTGKVSQEKTIVVDVQGLSKTYAGRIKAVDDITFRVLEGETFGFLGPNGAGKTTTIDLLTTQVRPTSGNAKVAGYDVLGHPNEVRKRISVVPQNSTSDEELNGYENVMVIASLYGIPKRQSKRTIEEVMNLVELEDAAKRKVRTYSGGMRRRLEIACGLVSHPKVLFLDEPSLGLDVQTREALWEYLQRLKEEYSMTLFVTTHYMEEADQLCDRVAIIDGGKVVRIGTPNEIKAIVGADIVELTVDVASDETTMAISETEYVASVERKGSDYRIKTQEGEKALPSIIDSVRSTGHKVKRVSLSKPTLSQAYLELTGRAFREEDPRREEDASMRRAFG